MLITNVRPADFVVLMTLSGDRGKSKDEIYSINGLSFAKEAENFDLARDTEPIIENWKKRKWLGENEKTGKVYLGRIQELLFRTVLNPARSFACSSDDGRFWGIYMKYSTIVLVYTSEQDVYDVRWLPVLSHALGSFYGFYRRVFDEKDPVDHKIECSFTDGETRNTGFLKRTGNKSFQFEDCELFAGERTFKEAFDDLTLWIAKAHGNCIREEMNDADIQR